MLSEMSTVAAWTSGRGRSLGRHRDGARDGRLTVTGRRGGEPDGPNLSATLANGGDGVAFHLTARGEACKSRLVQLNETMSASRMFAPIWSPLRIAAVVTPDDEFELRAECEEDQWDQAAVVIEWTRTPTWKRKRESLRMPLTGLARPASSRR